MWPSEGKWQKVTASEQKSTRVKAKEIERVKKVALSESEWFWIKVKVIQLTERGRNREESDMNWQGQRVKESDKKLQED